MGSVTENRRHLGHYPPGWQAVLQQAKLIFFGSIAYKSAFPEQEEGKEEAREIIRQVIAEFERDGVDLEEGMHLIT